VRWRERKIVFFREKIIFPRTHVLGEPRVLFFFNFLVHHAQEEEEEEEEERKRGGGFHREKRRKTRNVF
jgi:hypothetical protein